MIYSEKHNYIFVHIPKTGGTSIRKALAKTYHKSGLEQVPNQAIGVPSMRPVKHSPAVYIKRAVGLSSWNSFYRFAFVRNPWDWCVSTYHFIKKTRRDPRRSLVSKMSFDDFVVWLYNNLESLKRMHQSFNGQNSYIINKKGKVLVDFVGRFENLQDDYAKICNNIGIKPKILGTHNGTKHKQYKEYYTDTTINMVSTIFKKDINIFNYSY